MAESQEKGLPVSAKLDKVCNTTVHIALERRGVRQSLQLGIFPVGNCCCTRPNLGPNWLRGGAIISYCLFFDRVAHYYSILLYTQQRSAKTSSPTFLPSGSREVGRSGRCAPRPVHLQFYKVSHPELCLLQLLLPVIFTIRSPTSDNGDRHPMTCQASYSYSRKASWICTRSRWSWWVVLSRCAFPKCVKYASRGFELEFQDTVTRSAHHGIEDLTALA